MMRSRWAVVALASAALIGGACGGDGGSGPSGSVDLSGSYTLVKLNLGGFLDAPGSTGTLDATKDSVHADINLVSPDTALVPDTTLLIDGSYIAKHTASKDSIYVIISLGTLPGTFSITGAAKDTLSLTLLTSAGIFTTVWHKP